MKTLGEVLGLSVAYLEKQGILYPRRMAEELLAFSLKIKRLDLYMQFDRPLEEKELEVFRGFLKRKAQGEPLEHIFGEVFFLDCMLTITPDVLIPRPETEILLSKVISQIENLPKTKKVAWDICTGSGALGIALKKACPHLEVSISDISPKALAVAKKNVIRNDVAVDVYEGDLLKPFEGKKADIILCNPPYVTTHECQALDPSVKNFEPNLALDGGEFGTVFYERLAKDLPKYLNPGAKIFFEIGKDQGESIMKIFSLPCYSNQTVEKDWSSKNRFFFLEFE